MKTRVLSFALIFFLLLTLLPVSCLAASGVPDKGTTEVSPDEVIEEEIETPPAVGAKPISKVNLYVADPAIGNTPDLNVTVNWHEETHFTITGVEWYWWSAKWFVPFFPPNIFSEGETYQLRVTLTPDAGYSFAGSCVSYLNNTLKMNARVESDGTLYAEYTWDPLAYTYIMSLPLSITPPTAGAHPDNILISSADGWIQEVCTWFPDGGKIPVKSSDTFMAGEVYTLSVILRPWAGYRFADNCKVSLNGKTKFYSGDPYIDPDSIAFSINFECLNVPFVDVDFEAYYASPVVWAYTYKPQITAGTDATHFSPNAPCTRGQVVTFLWRAFGCPEPKNTKNAFVDVKKDAYYYKAILWAVEKGITNGTDPTHFSPNAPCTRGQVVTFLWRAKGEPSTSNIYIPFVDVPSKAFYYRPVCWAYVSNVTGGTDATHFSPNATCTRGQVVTFLFRALSNG